jgi:thiol-disulfide isomerase/thioredoxin
MKSSLRISGFLLAVLMWASCAAKLPREVTLKRPVGVETKIDLTQVNLTRLSDGAAVNVGAYMDERGLEWLALTFGSKSCGACMEKARYFQANLVGNGYGLLGERAQGRFELIGVTTDPTNDRDELLALIEDSGLSHLVWSDPAPVKDKMMMKYFQPSGMDFSVPLTIMLSREGLLWRVSSKDKLTPTEIIQKIATTIDANALPPNPQPPVPPGDDEQADNRPLLAKEQPNRLDQVPVRSCGDRREVLLGQELPPIDGALRAVLVYSGRCDEQDACVDARQAVRSWQARCSIGFSASCDLRELSIDDERACAWDQTMLGGREFFDVFADHFSWSYAPYSAGPGRLKLPELKGPLTLVFDAQGRLVFSREGAIGEDLDQQMRENRLSQRTPGPRFGVMYEDGFSAHKILPTRSTFDRLRLKSKYTMIMFWNTWCSSCTDELEEWHREHDSAYGYCKTHPDFCQVLALETGRADSGLSSADYLRGLVSGNDDFDGWIARRWTMPLAVELETSYDTPAPLGWFAGWVRARFGSSEPRTVLYDIEGKVVNTWRSLPGEHGPRDTLKKLFETEQNSK